jgi:hypothetical protein
LGLELHFICQHGLNHLHLKDEGRFESGDWYVSDDVANEAIGGRIFLHEKQSSPAWHGGRIVAWRPTKNLTRKIFTYEVDAPFRFVCRENWAQEKAVIRKPDHSAG